MKIMSYLSEMPTVVVMGDVMLDLYLSGRVSRISPEAPVPVLHHMAERAVAGGAANVALNLAQLGGRTRLLGLIGKDDGGAQLANVLRPMGLGQDLIASDNIETVTKTRVLAENHHQFLRIDREGFMMIDDALRDTVLARLEAALEGAGILVLSDYAKGMLPDDMLPRVIALANARGVPVMVDPKRPDFSIYKGVQIIKPNLNELSVAAGYDCHTDASRDQALKQISAQTGADILLTMSEKGMLYYPASGQETIHMATSAREVFDVSGAGDTVMALFAAVRAGGTSVETAMHVANIAAGLVIGKVGTAVLETTELDAALAQSSRQSDVSRPQSTGDDSDGEIMDLATAAVRCAEWKRNGLRVGFTNGCFDLLHPGHVRILQAARGFCDKLIVGLNTDASVQRLKGPTRPVQQQDARVSVMAAMGGVDGVVLFDEDTPLALIEGIVPDVLVKGADYEIKDIVGADFVLANNGEVERVPLKEGHSTTSLIARSKLSEASEAPAMSSVQQTAQEGLDWLNTAGLPVWHAHGMDRARGGFHEFLDHETKNCDADFRRLRTATRQTYVWAAAMRLGYPQAEEGLRHGIAFLTGPARHVKNGFCNRFNLEAKVTDTTRDLYDLAFVAFALAHAYDVTGDKALRDEAATLAAFITRDMRHASGGFLEALPPCLPRRQNPHMHLLEAALVWSALDTKGPFTAIAKELLTLFKTRLFNPETGALPEYFDDDLRPLSADQMVEPGHHFEWVWLLHHAARLGIADLKQEADALYAFAHRFGIGPSGVPHGALALDGQVLPVVTRIWAPCEWLKAEAVTTAGADRDARVGRAWAAMQRFLDAPTAGLWHERLDNGAFVPGPAPATSLYHLVLAIEVMCETAGCHPRPFAAHAAP